MCIFRRCRLYNELRIRFCSEWWRILNDFARFSQHEIFAICRRDSRSFSVRRERVREHSTRLAKRSSLWNRTSVKRSDQSYPKSVQSDLTAVAVLQLTGELWLKILQLNIFDQWADRKYFIIEISDFLNLCYKKNVL